MDNKEFLQKQNLMKSKALAFLLWFFLGTIGADRFYVNRKGEGVVMLILFIVSGILWFLIPFLYLITFVWVIINLFRIWGEVDRFNKKIIDSIDN